MSKILVVVVLSCACSAVQRPRSGIENPVVRLTRDIAKVERAIEATKRLLALSHSAAYVPDLYMRLAELYAEQSRYHYLIAYENDKTKNRAIVSIPARLLKQQAVQLYDRVAREFPEYQDLDKALFFKGHELRELGSYEEMIATFERLVHDHPKSPYLHQALIIIGDYHFDKTSFPRAEEYYRRVLSDSKEGPQHAMARYKMAWSRQNQEDCKGALSYFQATARTTHNGDEAQRGALAGVERHAERKRAAQSRRTDLRREALIDSGFCFTEVRRPEEAIPFYRSLAESRSVYVQALSRLARRYHSKGQFAAAASLYREILEVHPYHEDALELVQRFYEGLKKSPSPSNVQRDVNIIVGVAESRYFDPRTPEATRKAMIHDFEVYARDLSTKAQLQAKASEDIALFGQVATAYQRYLAFFRDVARVKEAGAIEANLADTLYAARRYIQAGQAYEQVAGSKGASAAEIKTALFAAAASYALALKKPLGSYEQAAARAGLYRAGRSYIARFPDAENLPELKFNIANALYNEGSFREAIVRFTSVAEQYPQSKEGAISAQLALDSYRLLYDMEGLARAGLRFLSDPRIKDEGLRKKISEVVAAAQQRQLDVLTVSAGTGEKGAETLMTFAQKNVGSALGEKALISAFMAARDGQDLERLVKIGDQLLRAYPRSSEIVGVLGTLGKLTAQAAHFDEAARYLAEAARREQVAARGHEMLRTAAVLLAQRGDRKGAEEIFATLQQAQAQPEILDDVLAALSELYLRLGDQAALIELARAPRAPADLKVRAIQLALASGAQPERFAPEIKALSQGGGDAGAAARLMLADLAHKQLEAIAFTQRRADDGKIIARRFALQSQVEGQYLQVVKLQQPRQIIAALGRLAELYQGAAEFLSGAPVPEGLSEQDQERYKAAFTQKAEPFLKKAKEALRTCAETALQLRVFSQAGKACVAGQVPARFEPLQQGPAPRPVTPEAPQLRARLIRNPSDGEAMVGLALMHLRGGDLYGAKLVADRAVEIGGPSLGAAHNVAGVSAYQLGEHAEAHRHFQEALRLDRRSPRARLNLSVLYREYGYGKLVASELSGLSDVPAELLRDPAVLPGASLEEKR